MLKIKNSSGYIALISLLIVAAAALTIGISVSLREIEEVQMAYGGSQSIRSKVLANACIEDGLEHLRKSWANYSGSLSFGPDSCIINAVVSGSTASLEASGRVDIYSQKIQAQISDNLDVLSWQEH